MQLKKVEQRLKGATHDGDALRRLAGDLGAEVFRARAEVLEGFRGLVSRGPVPDDFARGYRAALADVTAAVTLELQQRAASAEALAVGRQRRHREVLAALEEGPLTAKELCERGRCDKGQMSRVLGDLRRADLVEEYANPQGDGRERPQHLTLRGQQVLEQLGARSAAAGQVLEHLPQVLDVLLGSGRVSLHDVQHVMGRAPQAAGPATHALAKELFEALGRSHCVSNQTWALYANTVTPATQELHRILETCSPALIAREIRQRVGADVLVMVRSDAMRDAWRRILTEGAAQRGRTLESAELATGDEPPRDAYALVYESEDLRQADIARYCERIRAYEHRARGRYIVARSSALAGQRAASDPTPPVSAVSLFPIAETV
ncbi:MAG: MarR family transcriptional regulator [Polyangiales bacterium]